MNDPLTWSIGLLLAGLVLIVLELFIPSGGILGVLAGLAVLSAIVISFFDDQPMTGPIISLLAVIGVPAVIYASVKWWPDTPLGRLILIRNPPGSEKDESSGDDLHDLIGKRGRAKSKMLPSGAVVIDGRTYDAVSDGVPIEPGQTIRVIAVRNNRPLVRPADGLTPSPQEEEPQGQADVEDLSQPFDDFELDSLDDPLA